MLKSRKNIGLLVAIGLFIITIIIAGQLFMNNRRLQAGILETQTAANKRIEELEIQMKSMEQAPPVTKTDQQEGVSFMSETELLESYFTETPMLIESDTASSQTPEAPAADQNTDSAKAGAFLKASPEIADLGTISKKNGVAKAVFELKNEGNTDLIISYAFSSCGCTVAPLKEEVRLTPGSTYPLEVSYDPNFYGSDYELGPTEKTITVLSNDNSKPFYKLKLNANVTL